MKKLLIILPLLALLCLPCIAAEPDVRGVWVSTVYNLDYPSASGLNAAQLKAEADKMINDAANAGFNTIFLQVRPCCDAIYPSEIFPWSKYISGEQGKAPQGNFDVLDYYITECHKNGIELHAWINPFRVTVSSFDSIEAGLASLSENHPARRYSDHVRWGNDKKLYFDPAVPEVRQLIADGVKEIIDNYQVDGVHFDDYFYPDEAFDDSESFIKYGSDHKGIGDFRRDNVNKTVKLIHDVCAADNITFGIAPFGIWANITSHIEGSHTIGNQSYFSHYADSLYWVKNGLVDYIAPQLYWHIGSPQGEFETLLLWWRNAVKDTGVDLYIGLAAYRCDDAQPDSVWYNGQELERQLNMIDIYGQTKGIIMFRMLSVSGNDEIKQMLSRRFSYPMPEIGAPVFIKNPQRLEVISPTLGARAVSGSNAEVICASAAGGAVYAISGNSITRLLKKGDNLTGNVDIKDTSGILFIDNKNGVLCGEIIALNLLSGEKQNSLTDIDWEKAGDYTAISFMTDHPAAASCKMQDGYLSLTVSPCRVGLLFECPAISYMVTEKTGLGVKYTFALPQKPKDFYVEELNDRVILYFK